MIRAGLGIMAIGAIVLGLWMIASDFSPAPTPISQVIAAPHRTAKPVVAGTALLAGGVIFLVLIFRKR